MILKNNSQSIQERKKNQNKFPNKKGNGKKSFFHRQFSLYFLILPYFKPIFYERKKNNKKKLPFLIYQ